MKAAGNGKSNSKSSTPSPRPVLPDGDRGGFNSAAPQQSYVRLQQQHYLQQQQQHYLRQLEQQQHRYHQQQQHPQHYQQRLAYQQQLFAQQQFAYQQQQQLPYVQQQQHLYRQQQQHFAYQADPQLAYQHLRREPPLPQQQSPAQQQELQQHYVQQQTQGYQQYSPHDEGLHVRRPLQQQREVGHQQRLSSLPARGPLPRQQHQPYRRRQQHHYSLHQQEEDLVMHSVCTGGGSNTEGMETEGVASHYHYCEEPELRSRKDICSTAAAVLGLGRVTGVFLFVFAATVAAAIVFDTVGPPAHEYYISCHGSNVSVSHKVFLVLLSLQIFFIMVHWPLTAASSNVATAVPHHHHHNHHHHHHQHHTAGRARQQYQQQYYQGHLQQKHGEEEEEEEDEEQQTQQHLRPQQQRSVYSKAPAHSSSSVVPLYVSDGGGSTCSLDVSSLVPCHSAAGGGAAIESAGAAGWSSAHEFKRDVAAMHGQAAASGSCSENTLSLSCVSSSLASPPVSLCILMKQRSDAATSAAAPPAVLPTATAPAAPTAPPPAAAAPVPTKAAAAAAVAAASPAGCAAAAAGVPVAADAPATLAAQSWGAFKTCSHEEKCRIYSTFCQEEQQQQRLSLKFVSVAMCAGCPPDALESEAASAEGDPAYVPLESAAAAARTRGGGGATPARATAAEAAAAADAPATSASAPLVEEESINGVERHSPRSMLLPNRDKEREAVTVECCYGGEVAAASLGVSSRGPGVRTARLLLDSIVQGSSNRSSSRGRYIPAGGDTLDGSGDEEVEENIKGGESLGSSLCYPVSSGKNRGLQQKRKNASGKNSTCLAATAQAAQAPTT